MNCSISGEVPEVPVISRKSGHLFEKSLITKYIEAEGKCPVTGEELSLSDLLEVQANKVVRPRPATATSIPGMLALFQNEWDETVLETFTLRKHLDATRQELSQALYQHDAACRVIARLQRERDEARTQLQSQRAGLAQATANATAAPVAAPAPAPAAAAPSGGGGSSAMEVEQVPEDENGLTHAVMESLTDTWKELTKARKRREIPATLTPAATLSTWVETAQHTLHRTNPAGITSLAIHPTKSHITLTGGVDKTGVLFDTASGQQLALLAGHTKRVTDVAFISNFLLTASADGTARVYSEDGKCVHTLSEHTGDVTAVAPHPTRTYFATAGRDKAWAFYDLERGVCLKKVSNPAFEAGFECGRWHPDGLIFGTGTADAQVRIWDMKTQQNVASFRGHDGGAVGSIAFSENGYYMVSGGTDGTARMWDLRKLKNFHTVTVGPADNRGASAKVSFDHSGIYMAAAMGGKVDVYVVKEWTQAASIGDFKKPVSSVAFGPNASFLAGVSMDRTLRIFSAPA